MNKTMINVYKNELTNVDHLIRAVLSPVSHEIRPVYWLQVWKFDYQNINNQHHQTQYSFKLEFYPQDVAKLVRVRDMDMWVWVREFA